MVNYNGTDLTADTELIWKVGEVNFPAMAAAYSHATDLLDDTNAGYESVPTQFYPKWRKLRDELQSILATSSTNLEKTGAAIRRVVVDYFHTDSANADALRKAQKDLGTDAPEVPDPKVPYGLRGTHHSPGEQPPKYAPGTEHRSHPYHGHAPKVDALIKKAEHADDLRGDAVISEMDSEDWAFYQVAPKSWFWSEPNAGPRHAISPHVKAMAKNDASEYQLAIDGVAALTKLTKSHRPFSDFAGEVNDAAQALDDDNWDSDAARAFKANFLNRYPSIKDRQLLVAAELEAGVTGYQNALHDCYTALDQVLDHTIAAYKAIIDSNNGSRASVTVAVLSAAITGGASIAAGTGLTMSFAAGTTVSVGSAALTAGGATEAKTTKAAVSAIKTIHRHLSEFDSRLASALDDDYNVVVDRRKGLPIEIPRPAFADDPRKL